MSLYKNKGFKRLAIVISGIAFICTYITLCLIEYRVETKELLIGFPIASALSAIGTFISIRIIYWVIDGFRSSAE